SQPAQAKKIIASSRASLPRDTIAFVPANRREALHSLCAQSLRDAEQRAEWARSGLIPAPACARGCGPPQQEHPQSFLVARACGCSRRKWEPHSQGREAWSLRAEAAAVPAQTSSAR